MAELIQVVDESDQPLRGDTMENAWKEGLWHRIAYVMVFSPSGKALLQMRTAQKETYPNCWDVSAGGHVDEGEDYETAARRELEEELGLSTATLEALSGYQTQSAFEWRRLKRFNRVYKTVIEEDAELRLQASEVSKISWFEIDEIKELIAKHPELVADGLVSVMAHLNA